MRCVQVLAFTLIISISSCNMALSQNNNNYPDRWNQFIALYTWLNNQDGGISIRGNPGKYEPGQVIAELGASYLINTKPVSFNGRFQRMEVLGGIRYNEVTFRSNDLGVTLKDDQEWLDPYVGIKFSEQIPGSWILTLRGDIGGFGIGDASDFTWNFMFSAGYELSPALELDFGWRWLDVNYETGTGVNNIEYDVLLNGPFLALQYKL